jgi:hypothetical protein
MKTNQDRITELRAQIGLLNERIVTEGKQQDYMAMVQQIADGKIKFEPLDEDQWNIMLPSEQKLHLLRYCHTFRLEMQELLADSKKPGMLEQATSWLESPWVKRPVAAGGIISLTWTIIQHLHLVGILAREDSGGPESPDHGGVFVR